METFLDAYITCALWSSMDNATEQGGEPLDRNYDRRDLAPEALATMTADCEQFQREQAKWLANAGNDAQNGHDFWLTRNHHGAGFWDRGYPDAIGDRLTEAAHAFGQCDIYIGDNGRLYLG